MVQETKNLDSVPVEERLRGKASESGAKQASQGPMEGHRQDHPKASGRQVVGKHKESRALERVFGNKIHVIQQHNPPLFSFLIDLGLFKSLLMIVGIIIGCHE